MHPCSFLRELEDSLALSQLPVNTVCGTPKEAEELLAAAEASKVVLHEFVWVQSLQEAATLLRSRGQAESQVTQLSGWLQSRSLLGQPRVGVLCGQREHELLSQFRSIQVIMPY